MADEPDAGAPPTDVTGSPDVTAEDAGADDGSSGDESHSDVSPSDQRSTDHASEESSTPEPSPQEGGPRADADAACACCNMPCRDVADAGPPDTDAAVDADAADADFDADAADLDDGRDASADARRDRDADSGHDDDADAGDVADADARCACTPEDDLGNLSFPCFCERSLCPRYDAAVSHCSASKFWLGNRIDTYADCNLLIVSHLDEVGYSEYVYDASTRAMVGGVFAADSAGYVCGSTPVYGFRAGAYPPETCALTQSVYRCGDGGSAAGDSPVRQGTKDRSRAAH